MASVWSLTARNGLLIALASLATLGSAQDASRRVGPSSSVGPFLDTLDRAHLVKLAGSRVPPSIPEGSTCSTTRTLCFGTHERTCTVVCDRGSLYVDPWLNATLSLERKLAHGVPLCDAVLPGTHNSAITIADGYGNSDAAFSEIVRFVDKGKFVRTNDQYFSLTDQLRLGVRVLELDTHYFLGQLRIAHCGGLHVKWLDKLIREVAVELNKTLDWDTETVGCDPSLSGIPARDQRTLASALAEVADFLDAHPGEFVIIFFDDQIDLGEWGVVPRLMSEIAARFNDTAFTPADLAAHGVAGNPGAWPSIDQMLSLGKRAVFLSGADYGDAMRPFVFPKHGAAMCNWTEPGVDAFESLWPSCRIGTAGERGHAGQIVRVETSQLEYGPINGGSSVPLDESNIPDLLPCSNFLCPDLATPQRLAAFAWSFAPGEPSLLPDGHTTCTFARATDGRWVADSCSASDAMACGPEVRGNGAKWSVVEVGTPCPEGTSSSVVPWSPFENTSLRFAIAESGSKWAKIAYVAETGQGGRR